MKRIATDLPGGATYCSDQLNRCYVRKFDWDKARALHAEGRTIYSIAKELGVAWSAIKRVVDPETARRMNEAHDRWQKSGICFYCGVPCLPATHPSQRGDVTRCHDCAMRASRTCWFENDDGTLTVRCALCKEWRPESDFPPQLRIRYDAGESPHGGTRSCRVCSAAARRLYRATHPEQRERENRRRMERHYRGRAAKELRTLEAKGGDGRGDQSTTPDKEGFSPVDGRTRTDD